MRPLMKRVPGDMQGIFGPMNGDTPGHKGPTSGSMRSSGQPLTRRWSLRSDSSSAGV
jgi:hypothetical protein